MVKRKKGVDLPLSLEDLKFGAKQFIDINNLQHVNEKLATMKKDKIENLKNRPGHSESDLLQVIKLKEKEERERQAK
jgi:hypothetical protein